jgi:hypothetical protein
MLGQRSFLRMPHDANINVAIPMIAINFAFFMISELVYKINAFEGISDVLSEINLSESPIVTPTIGQIQKKFGEFAPLALEQYKLRVKSVQKLPQHARAGCLFWQRAFEQCSSEAVALWKAQAFPVETLLSITGGLGVDEWAWSKNGTHVISCDIQSDLNALVRYNQARLQCSYERLDMDAQSLLSLHRKQTQAWVYVDPDRRQDLERLGGYWEQFQPSIGALIDAFGTSYSQWIVKMSPMTDFRVLRKALPGKIQFTSIFYQGEVKELLLHISVNEEAITETRSIYLDSSGAVTEFSAAVLSTFAETVSPEIQNDSQAYIFEPNGGLNNLNLNGLFSGLPFMTAQNQSETLFTSAVMLPFQWGRCKAVIRYYEGSLNDIKRGLQRDSVVEASVKVRDARGLKSELAQQKLGLRESAVNVLFITQKGPQFGAWLAGNEA